MKADEEVARVPGCHAFSFAGSYTRRVNASSTTTVAAATVAHIVRAEVG